MIRIPIFLMLPFLAVACATPREPAVKKVSPPESYSPQRHAIVIGVNEYPRLHNWNLRGAARDARSMGEALTSRFGFDSVRSLIAAKDRAGDERLATVQATRDAMQAVLQEAGKGDIVLFYFSGHGCELDDQPPGVEGHDESDTHRDSALVLHDSSMTERVLRDDELGAWSQALLDKDASILTIFDACHSGTAFRSSGLRPRGLPRPKGFVPSVSAKPGFATLPDGVVSLSACLDEEQAFETGQDPAGGVFTTHLLAALRTSRPGTTYEVLHNRVLARVRAWQAVNSDENQMQTPVLRGGRRADGRRKLLFSSSAVHGSSIPDVIGRREKGATLSVGIVQGATVGSKFLVYDAGVTPDQILTRNAPRAIGVLEIEIVFPTSCRGRWIMIPPKDAELGLAVCIEAPLSEVRLAIRLDASLPGPVADGLAALIQKAGPPLDRLVLARGEVDAGQGEVKEIASFGRDDQDFTLTVSGQEPLAVPGEEPRDLLRVLRKLMDHRALTSLRAPEPNLLAGKVELMVRVDPKRRERPLSVQEFEELDTVLPRESSGEIVFKGAESGKDRTFYSVAVKNHGVLTLYGYLFNLTPDLKIEPEGIGITLKPNKAITVIKQFAAGGNPGIECMKLIASTEAIPHMESLAQGRVTRGGPMGSLMRQMRRRMGRPTMRSGTTPGDAAWSGTTPDDGIWITSEAFWRVQVR